jgi:glycosyltransferase involved in cell wall biosynthesis
VRGGPTALDVLIVSLGSTLGLRAADEELAASLQRAGASVRVAHALARGGRRTLMLTDLGWARAARAATAAELTGPDASAGAVIYSSTTAALLWRRPGAMRFDASSFGNRAGRHGLWQRPLERQRLQRAPLLLPWSRGALDELPAGARATPAVVLPVPVEPSAPTRHERDIAAVTYAANPSKKGLDRVLSAWRRVRERSPDDALELVVAGATRDQLEGAGFDLSDRNGVTLAGPLPAADYRALLRRARVFLCAPRREDYGLAQLEALADGCQLVTTPAPGPYVALPIARELDPRLVGEDLAGGLLAALQAPLPDYPARVRLALRPFTRAAADRVVAEQLLPRLLG